MISGKSVKPELWDLTTKVLAEFNEQTGKAVSATTGSGQPSESAKRIYLRVADWPELTFEQHKDIIARTLTSKWWGEDVPSIGVVYGPKVFEDNMTRKPTPKQDKDAGRKARAARGRAAIQRIIDQHKEDDAA